jgi:hypothetical protein
VLLPTLSKILAQATITLTKTSLFINVFGCSAVRISGLGKGGGFHHKCYKNSLPILKLKPNTTFGTNDIPILFYDYTVINIKICENT